LRDQRLVEDALGLQGIDEATDRTIQLAHHGCMDAAVRVLDVAVALDRLGWCLVRQVWRVEARVEEERSPGIARLDQSDGLVRDQVRAVPLLTERLAIALPVQAATVHVIPVADAARRVAIEVVEPTSGGEVVAVPVAEVPFAGQEGLVAGFAKPLGQQTLAERKTGGIVLAEWRHDTEAQGRLARHQGRARRAATGLCIETVEHHALCGEPIEPRRRDLAAVIADVSPTEIVCEDDHDIRPLQCVGCGRRYGREQSERRKEPPAHHVAGPQAPRVAAPERRARPTPLKRWTDTGFLLMT
jgi:hypothetical protein